MAELQRLRKRHESDKESARRTYMESKRSGKQERTKSKGGPFFFLFLFSVGALVMLFLVLWYCPLSIIHSLTLLRLFVVAFCSPFGF